MSANQPPASPPAPKPPGRGSSIFLIIVGVVALGGIIGGLIKTRQLPVGTDGGTSVSTVDPLVSTPGPTSAFDSDARPPPAYAAFENTPETASDLFWLDVLDPKAVHQTVRKNAWLGKAMKDPLGQGFLAAWGGFLGTRGEDIGEVFKGAVSELVLDQLLSSPYRVVWFGGEISGTPAVVIPRPSQRTIDAFDTLVKVAASGGFDPPSCTGAAGADGGASDASLHRVVLADKIVFIAKLADRLVVSPRPQPALVAMCGVVPELATSKTAVATLGFAPDDAGRGTQSLSAILGTEGAFSFDFKIENDGFVPTGLSAKAEAGGRLVAATPSPELLKAIPDKSGVVLFLAMKLPKDLSALSLRDMLAPEGETFKGTRKEWPLEERQLAVIWNPRGNASAEIAVLWGNAADEKGLDQALEKGSGKLLKGKACSVLAFASTKELLADLQSACAGKRPSVLQAAPAIARGLGEATSIGLTVNLGAVFSQLTLDGWLSEHVAGPNQRSGPQEIEAARKLLEELPTVGFRATVAADGSITSGGFRS